MGDNCKNYGAIDITKDAVTVSIYHLIIPHSPSNLYFTLFHKNQSKNTYIFLQSLILRMKKSQNINMLYITVEFQIFSNSSKNTY